MQYIGHTQCYKVLEDMLAGFERGGYNRLVQYGLNGESILLDSKPAPGYTPNTPGKKETGVAYVPNCDGTDISVYYMAAHKPDAEQIDRASLAVEKQHQDKRKIMGKVVSIKRCKNGNIQLMFVAFNRVVKDEDGNITDALALDSVTVGNDPAVPSGRIIALALDQDLGVAAHQLKAMAEAESEVRGTLVRHLEMARLARGIPTNMPGAAAEPRNAGTPAPAPVREE